MSDESTSIRDGCVAPRVSDPDDTMVGTLGPTETEAGTSPKGEGDAPAEHIGPEPEQLKRKSFAVPGYHYIRRVVDTMVGTLGPTETEAQASPREDDDAPAEHIGPEPEQLKRKVVGVPGYHYIRRARSGRFEVQIKGVGQGSRGGVHLGTVDTLKEAVELYNDVARTQGKPAQPLPDEPDPEPEPDPIHPALLASDVPEKRQSVHEHETEPDLVPDAKRRRLALAEFEAPKAAPAVHGKGKDKWTKTAIPAGLKYIRLTNSGRYRVEITTAKSKTLYLGLMDTLHGALWLYNKEARLLGKPTQEIPADSVAPEPDVPPTMTQAPKHTSSPNDQKKKKYTAVPGYRGIRVSSTSGRFELRGCGSHGDCLYRTVDTLREAVELYNKEAKKRGKPIQPLPDDKLDVPELNVCSTVVPGLKGINMMTVDGKFMAQFYQGSQGFRVGVYDTLDEAVKEQNAAGAARLSEWVTARITAEHRAVVKEMERKREVFIPKKTKMTTRQHDKAHAPAITRLRPRPEPAAEKARPKRARTPKRPAGVAPAEMTSTGGASAAAAAAAPAHLDESAELDRLREENEQLLEINESLIAMAQRVMGMAARMSQATQ